MFVTGNFTRCQASKVGDYPCRATAEVTIQHGTDTLRVCRDCADMLAPTWKVKHGT